MSYTKLGQIRISKFKNTKTGFNGKLYHSKLEASFAMYLESERKAKRIKWYKEQVREELRGENKGLIAHYKVDFLVGRNDDKQEFIEVKGFRTRDWALKWKLLKDKYKFDSNTICTIWP